MSRRHRAERREITPDAKFGDLVLAKFMNSLMYDGKKSAAEGIIYGAFDTIAAKTKQDPIVICHDALKNVSPALEVRSRRVGGATYQVPVEVRTDRSRALAIRWLITAARGRNEPTMTGRLSGELMDATLGVIQPYIEGARDGWDLTLDALVADDDGFLDRLGLLGAVMDFADLMALAGVIENALRRRRLAGIDMRGNADVAIIYERSRAGH